MPRKPPANTAARISTADFDTGLATTLNAETAFSASARPLPSGTSTLGGHAFQHPYNLNDDQNSILDACMAPKLNADTALLGVSSSTLRLLQVLLAIRKDMKILL